MAELQQKKQDLTIPPPGEKDPSGGELLFDRVVYTGIGFGVNEVSSLWITDQFMHGRNLFKNTALEKPGEWFSEEGYNKVSDMVASTFKLGEKMGSDGKMISSRARGGNALLMVTLISGGTLLILPMKSLEDNKTAWVQRANHLLDKLHGNTLSPEEVQKRDAEVEQQIACSPRQSWPAMMFGRVLAVSASIATGTFLMGPERNKRLMDWSERTLTGSIQPEGHRTAAHRYARLASVETYSCATASVVLEVMSKLFARRASQPHDPEKCRIAAAAAAASRGENYFDANVTDAERESYYAERIKAQKEQAAGQALAV